MLGSTCWLVFPDDRKLEVQSSGLLVGRSLAANVLLEHPSASRRAALVYVDLQGPHVVRLGRGPVSVNSTSLGDLQSLDHGDVLGFPGLQLRVAVECPTQGEGSGWVLRLTSTELGREARLAELGHEEFSVGAEPEADLQLEGWPEGAARLRPTFSGTWRVDLAEEVTVNGVEPDQRRGVVLRSGDSLTCRGEALLLLDVASTRRDTAGDLGADLPWKVELQPLMPAGGQITVHQGREQVTAFIPGLRFDLLQVLLQPRGQRKPGEALPDGEVLPAIWGRKLPSDRKAVTTLLQRLRRDLEKADIEGSRLLVRAKGRTGFLLAPGAEVVVHPPK